MRDWSVLLLLLALACTLHAQEPPDEPQPDGKPRLVLAIGGHTAFVMKIFFTPDGKQLVSVGRDLSVRYWDAVTGELQRTLHIPCHVNPFRQANMAALSTDRRTLVLCGHWKLDRDGTTRPYVFVNIPAGRIERVLHVPPLDIGVNMCLGLSQDGKQLATGNARGTAIWDIETAKLVRRFDLVCHSLSFNPAGNQLLVTTGDALSVLHLASGKIEKASGPLEMPHTGLWLDQRRAVACAQNGLVVQTLQKQKKMRTVLGGQLRALAWDGASQDGLLVAGGQLAANQKPRVTLVDVLKGEERRSFLFPDGETGTVRDVACHDNIVAATCGEVIYLWEKNSGKRLAKLGGQEQSPVAAGWDRDNRTIAWGQRLDPQAVSAGSGVGAARLFLDQRPLERAFHLGELRLVAGAHFKDFQRNVFEQGLRELRVLKGQVVNKAGKTIGLTAVGQPTSGSLLPQNRVILGMFNGVMRYYDAQTGKPIHRVNFKHRAAVTACAPSPDGRFLLTASEDHTLKIWDISVPRKEQVLLSLFASGQDWIIWTEEGYYAATPGGEKMMGWTINNDVGKIATFLPAERFRKQLYRPDVIKLVLAKGSVTEALKAANAALPEKERPKTDAPADLEQLLPPKATLKILQGAGGQVTVQVSAAAQVKSQPIVALRLLLNGRPFPEVAVKEFEPPQARAEMQWTVELPPGKSTLSVLARSEDASAVYEGVALERGLAAQRPVLHVLAIGINDYSHGIPKLGCAVNDAQELAKTFPLAKQGNLFSEVKTYLLTDQQASAAGIRAQLAKLRPQLQREDVLVLFFAGHGVREGKDFYLLTAEADPAQLAKTALSGQELSQRLRDLRCQVLLLLDACHSGSVVNNLRPATDDAARTFADDEVGVTVLAAAMGHEKALEANGNGYFTAAIKQALAGGKGVPSNPRDHRLYVRHLYTYVTDAVANRSEERQHPFLSLPSTVAPCALRQFIRPDGP